MPKINYLIILLFLFSHCSIDTKSGLWQNKNFINDEKNLSEINFNKTVDNIRGMTNKIIIVISHDIGSISHYDNIIVMQEGEVTGIGQHDTLLLSNDWYKNVNF